MRLLTHLRLSARTLRSLTPEGVIQEIYSLLVAHTVIRTLMLRAAEPAHIPPTQISFTATVHIMDNNLIPLGLVEPRRQHIVESVLQEIGQQRLPKQRVRIQPRVVKRARSRYERKKPEHLQAPALELDVDFYETLLWSRAYKGFPVSLKCLFSGTGSDCGPQNELLGEWRKPYAHRHQTSCRPLLRKMNLVSPFFTPFIDELIMLI